MSLSRQTELMESEAVGYLSEQVTATSGAEEFEIKDAPGKVARIRSDSAITVTLRDGTTDMWTITGSGEELDLGGTPLQHNTDIRLHLSGNGDAWIIYK